MNFVSEAIKSLKESGRIYFSLGEMFDIKKALSCLPESVLAKEIAHTIGHRPVDKKSFHDFLKSKGVNFDYSSGSPTFKIHVFETMKK